MDHDDIDPAAVSELIEAVGPFAEFGLVFTPAGPKDTGTFASTPDSTPIQIGATQMYGWSVTVGQLRRLWRAYEVLGPEWVRDLAREETR